MINSVDVLILLEDGPHHESELREWLNASRATLRVALKTLKRAGQVKRVGTARRWALARYTAPVGRPPAGGRRPRARVATASAPPAAPPAAPPSKSPWRAPKPPSNPVAVAHAPKEPAPVDASWWTRFATPETPFEDFSAAAAARDAEMSVTSANWRSQKAAPNT